VSIEKNRKNDKGNKHTTATAEPTAAQLWQSVKLPVAKIKQNGTKTARGQQQKQRQPTAIGQKLQVKTRKKDRFCKPNSTYSCT